MSKTLSLLAIIVLVAGAGCTQTVSGSRKATIPLAKNTIESRYQRPVDEIFKAARSVLELHGTLTGENTINSSLEAQVDNRSVYVRVDEVEPGVSRVQVQAIGKGGRGDVDLAAEIDKMIALKLATGNAR
jgi:hypothetical protein